MCTALVSSVINLIWNKKHCFIIVVYFFILSHLIYLSFFLFLSPFCLSHFSLSLSLSLSLYYSFHTSQPCFQTLDLGINEWKCPAQAPNYTMTLITAIHLWSLHTKGRPLPSPTNIILRWKWLKSFKHNTMAKIALT